MLGPRTIALLCPEEKEQVEAVPIWYTSLLNNFGMHENLNNRLFRDYFKSDGETLGDPSKIHWCGDDVQTAISLPLPD